MASCCTSFKSHEIRGLMFTLDEEQIFELTNGSHKKTTLKQRPGSRDSPELQNTVFFDYQVVKFLLDIYEMNDRRAGIQQYSGTA